MPSNAASCCGRNTEVTIPSRSPATELDGSHERTMGEPGTPRSPKSHDGRLDSWKEIAAYLGRDVTTVQRWEKRERMPVHRHLHDRMGSVYAFREELDAWVEARNVGPGKAPEADDGIVYGSGEVERRRGTSRFLASTRQIALPLALAALGGLIGLALWLRAREYFWRNPVAGARFQNITDIDGVQQAATISRDGQFVAFLSDREGQMDVWLTQMGSGQFHNLTHGAAGELANPSVRTLGFAPDGSLVTFWVRKQEPSGGADIGLWAVPTLGGQPRPYLKAPPNSTGRATGRGLCITRPVLVIRSTLPRGWHRQASGYSLRPPDYIPIFRCGRLTRSLSISYREFFPTNWISGGFAWGMASPSGSLGTRVE